MQVITLLELILLFTGSIFTYVLIKTIYQTIKNK